MNNDRRKRIAAIQATLEEAKSQLEGLASEERDAFDNLSEGLQQTEAGRRSEEAADALDDAVSGLDDAISNLDAYAVVSPMHAFITHAHDLAKLFTQPSWRRPELHGKYLEDGQKPVEAFVNDIHQNLQAWACEGESVFYRTHTHWYQFQRIHASELTGGPPVPGSYVVWMTRYRNGTWQRMDDWANVHTVDCVGRKFLEQHKSKQLPLLPQGDA